MVSFKNILLQIIFFPFVALGQNLVPNNSFELYTNCPNSFNQIYYATSWLSASAGSPDYYNSCTSFAWVSVPSNICGFENAHSGYAYSGILTFRSIANNIREYIEIELTDSLIQGNNYYLEFFISLADSGNYATVNVGAYFSDYLVQSSDTVLYFSPQILNHDTNAAINKLGWSKISGVYKANGDEKYLIIGSFTNDSDIDTIFVGGGMSGIEAKDAYYFIDDVYVGLDSIVDASEQPLIKEEIKIYPNPATTAITIEPTTRKNEVYHVELHTIFGGTVLNKKIKSTVSIDISALPQGVYMVGIKNKNGVVAYRNKLIKN